MEKVVPANTLSVLTLNDGVKMPLFGLGTWNASVDGEAEMAILHALKHGYRLIDTAAVYGNERDVGRAVKKSGLKREEIFVVTKLASSEHGHDRCIKACKESLKRLDMDYVDLYLIHSPSGGKNLETYDAMLTLKKEGLIRSVGVSNFGVQHLKGLQQAGRPAPSVNQLELHPYWRCEDIVKYCQQHHIGIMGYCPLIRCKKHADPVLVEMTKRYPGKTVSHVLLHWGIQNGYITIPKSSNPGRIEENAQIFDFEISNQDMEVFNSFPVYQCSKASSAILSPWSG